MPDITMCEGFDCKKKNECYRYRAIPSKKKQFYFTEAPYQDDQNCPEFYEILTKRLRPISSKND